MEDSNRMIITDDSGQEHEVEILFTFDDEKHGKSYVLFTDPADPDRNVFAYSYDEDGNLTEVIDEDEFEMCQEVLGAFQDEEENND